MDYLIPEGSATYASPLLPAMADIEEDVGLQQGLLVEDRVWSLTHRLPASHCTA